MYDLIGHIGGHRRSLETTLAQLGYEQVGGIYRHGSRKALFLGDVLGSGPDSTGCYRLIREMVDRGYAIWLMGDHEVEALLHRSPKSQTKSPRSEDSPCRRGQMWSSTLSPSDFQEALTWFHLLPLWFELPTMQAVHARWDAAAIQYLTTSLPGRRIPEDFSQSFSSRDEFTEEAIRSITGLGGPLAAQSTTYARPAKLQFTSHTMIEGTEPLNPTSLHCELGQRLSQPDFVRSYRWTGEELLQASALSEIR